MGLMVPLLSLLPRDFLELTPHPPSIRWNEMRLADVKKLKMTLQAANPPEYDAMIFFSFLSGALFLLVGVLLLAASLEVAGGLSNAGIVRPALLAACQLAIGVSFILSANLCRSRSNLFSLPVGVSAISAVLYFGWIGTSYFSGSSFLADYAIFSGALAVTGALSLIVLVLSLKVTLLGHDRDRREETLLYSSKP